jgi:catechol-2,3-dioxygenase
LQHFSLHVATRDGLDEWMGHLDALGIPHSGVVREGPGLVVRFHDPDGIPVEVCWPDMDTCREMWEGLAWARAEAARERRRRRRET